MFLAGNYLSADDNSVYDVTVTVLDRCMEQHEKQHKVGKHRYVSDGMRYEYYQKARKDRTKVLSLAQGGLGLPFLFCT